MTDLQLLLRIQSRMTAFLAGLSVDTLHALADGSADLTVVEPRPQPRPGPSPATVDAVEVVTSLRACETVEQGAALLAARKLSAADLRAVAKALRIPVSGAKAELTRKILMLTLAGRGKHAALTER